MRQEWSIRWFGALATLVGISIISTGVVFGHGGEKHDSTKPTEMEPTDRESFLQEVELDSIYATIQSEFAGLEPVFKKGCFNCHTTRTEYPWYHKVPVVKGMIDDDIKEAKKHLEMSQGFPFGGHGKPVDDLVAIREVVVTGEMPPLSYRMMHWSAKPSDSERDSIVAWVERGLASLATIGVHPTESEHPR